MTTSPSSVGLNCSDNVTSSNKHSLSNTTLNFSRICVIFSPSYFAIQVCILPVTIGVCRHPLVYNPRRGLSDALERRVKVIVFCGFVFPGLKIINKRDVEKPITILDGTIGQNSPCISHVSSPGLFPINTCITAAGHTA